MADTLKPDLCVIGGGAGGIAAAVAARAAGRSVVLVERGDLGGARLFGACIPSKALIAAAERAEMVRHSGRFGIATEDPKVNFARVHAHIQGVVRDLAPAQSAEHLEALGITVLRETARFSDRGTVAAGDNLIKARRFFIATGSRPSLPGIPGLDAVDHLTSDTVFDLAHRPSHLLVLGAGQTGLELAQAFLRLGSAVTVVDIGEPLRDDDPELVAVVLRRLAAEGLKIYANTGVVAVRKAGEGIELDLKTGAEEWTVTGSHLLVATGRRSNLEDLGLEVARVAVKDAAIAVDAQMRTTNPRVYAVGDVAGARLSSLAMRQGEAVGRGERIGEVAAAWATFTDPEIAHVGLTETILRGSRRNDYSVLRLPVGENARAATLRRTEGLIKLVVDARGHVLGASAVGPLASETIALFALAIDNRLTLADLARFSPPSPSLAEAVRQIAAKAGAAGGGPATRSPIAALRRLLP